MKPAILKADDWEDYALLDCGDQMKLERFGPWSFARPEPQALWAPSTPVERWRADATFSGRDGEEMGRWSFNRTVPPSWPIRWGETRLLARCTPFRHMGLFPEQSVHWRWARTILNKTRIKEPEVLNLFGYTGAASLVCAQAGAKVTHVDASKKAIGFARESQGHAGLADAPIRWICDDALAFVEREVRRGRRYHGIILDPPKHGRGPDGQLWTLETGLKPLLAACTALLADDALFLAATVYAVRLSFLALERSLTEALGERGGAVEAGEMALVEQGTERLLPTAIFARWRA